jgi:hypothetical protein
MVQPVMKTGTPDQFLRPPALHPPMRPRVFLTRRQYGGPTHIAMPVPASRPIAKTAAPTITLDTDRPLERGFTMPAMITRPMMCPSVLAVRRTGPIAELSAAGVPTI